jgi:GNAT superfamily N-acetyltransferase
VRDQDSRVHTVRHARPDDIAELVALCKEHAHFERAAYDTAAKADQLAEAVFSAPPRLYAWVALAGERDIIGYATAAPEYSTWSAREYLHLDCLFVRSARRRTGVGVSLLHSVIGLARELGLHEVQWQTPQWNVDACRFYRRHGGVDQHKLRFILGVAHAGLRC